MHSLEDVREALQDSLLGSNSSWGEAPGSRGSSRLPEPEWLPRATFGPFRVEETDIMGQRFLSYGCH